MVCGGIYVATSKKLSYPYKRHFWEILNRKKTKTKTKTQKTKKQKQKQKQKQNHKQKQNKNNKEITLFAIKQQHKKNNKTTKQQNNKTTKQQQNNKTTKQQNTAEQQIDICKEFLSHLLLPIACECRKSCLKMKILSVKKKKKKCQDDHGLITI